MLEYCAPDTLGSLAHVGLLSFPYRLKARIGSDDFSSFFLYVYTNTLLLEREDRLSVRLFAVALPTTAISVAKGGYVYGEDGNHYRVDTQGTVTPIKPVTMGRYYQPLFK